MHEYQGYMKNFKVLFNTWVCGSMDSNLQKIKIELHLFRDWNFQINSGHL